MISDHPYLNACAIFASVLAGALYYFQGVLIYPSNFPAGSRKFVPTPDEFSMPNYQHLTLTTPDKVKIRAYVIPRTTEAESRAAVTILYLHANAGNMGHRLPLARKFYYGMKANIFMLSYRGYGLSEGEPSEKGLCIDAQTALDYILADPILGKTKIVLYAQSIGGAVAINLLSKNEDRIHAAVLENTFLSVPKLIPNVMPYLRWFSFLCHQRWESEKAITRIKNTPMLFLAGEKDTLVPPSHMKQLFELCTTKGKKVMMNFPDGDHNDTCVQAGYFEAIFVFISDVISR